MHAQPASGAFLRLIAQCRDRPSAPAGIRKILGTWCHPVAQSVTAPSLGPFTPLQGLWLEPGPAWEGSRASAAAASQCSGPVDLGHCSEGQVWTDSVCGKDPTRIFPVSSQGTTPMGCWGWNWSAVYKASALPADLWLSLAPDSGPPCSGFWSGGHSWQCPGVRR